MWRFYFLFNKILNTGLNGEEEKMKIDSDFLSPRLSNRYDHSSIERGCLDSALPKSLLIHVRHVNQLHSWDCGLACVVMALNTVGITDCCLEDLIALCNTTSIWTVDLAFILLKFSVKFSYFTVTLGANPNYLGEKFYNDQLPADLVRVDRLFQNAVSEGIDIQCRSVSQKELSLKILSGNFIAIVLIDLYKLSHSWLEEHIISGFESNIKGYTGHYIIICGYDGITDEFEIKDPASSRKRNRIASKCLEEARKSFGTDEDLILIDLGKSMN